MIEAAFGEPGKLCVHFDPDKTDRSRLREMIEKTGARLTNQFGNATWTTPPISGPGNAEQAAEMLGRITGVVVAEVEPGRRIRIEYDREQIQKAELRGMLALMGAQKGECSNE
ncbi:5,10-methylenetetrahydrofolate reductase [Salinibacter ruber]|nr:5,10-methylenetetrahydrofolate reductase [Salinibacter ruber]